MDKAYIIYESWGRCDDSSIIGVYLDEKKADDFVKEKNRAYEKEMKKYEQCSRCRGENYANDEDGAVFRFKNSCDKAVIKEDRHGSYCENDDSEYYEAVVSNAYWKVQKDILE